MASDNIIDISDDPLLADGDKVPTQGAVKNYVDPIVDNIAANMGVPAQVIAQDAGPLNVFVPGQAKLTQDPTGQALVITHVAARRMADEADMTSGPIVGIGAAQGVSDLIPSLDFSALTKCGQVALIPLSGVLPVVPAGTQMWVNMLTPGSGGAGTRKVRFDLLGYRA